MLSLFEAPVEVLSGAAARSPDDDVVGAQARFESFTCVARSPLTTPSMPCSP